jgi:GNAT superfamily N-acetyltransferase
MNFPLFVRKFQRNLEDYGWSITLRRGLGYLFKPVYAHHVYRIYRIDLTEPHVPAEPEEHGLIFKILDPDNDRAIDQIENLHEWLRGRLKESIKSGALCLTAFEGECVAGFNLIGFGEVFMPLVNKKRTFRKQHAWSEQIAVHKDFRQRGLGAQLRYRIFEELRGRGFKRLYGGTLPPNIASLKLARKVGFREIVDLHYTRILGYDTWRYKRVKQ